MKVLVIKTDNTVHAVKVNTQWNNEISFADIRKHISSRPNILYVPSISRLAYVYVLFVEKDRKDRPVNIIATILSDSMGRPVRGNAILARSEHMGDGATKTFALDDDEITKIVGYMSKNIDKKIVLAQGADNKR